jgi:hypothetical protein
MNISLALLIIAFIIEISIVVYFINTLLISSDAKDAGVKLDQEESIVLDKPTTPQINEKQIAGCNKR